MFAAKEHLLHCNRPLYDLSSSLTGQSCRLHFVFASAKYNHLLPQLPHSSPFSAATPLYIAYVAIHNTPSLHLISEQGRGEHVLKSDVWRSSGGEGLNITKAAQIEWREDSLKGGKKFQRASIAMPQKQKMPKIEQRIIISG